MKTFSVIGLIVLLTLNALLFVNQKRLEQRIETLHTSNAQLTQELTSSPRLSPEWASSARASSSYAEPARSKVSSTLGIDLLR